ncbi:YbaK/EbsC family protein [Pseudothauera rhizosphaerae]|uniref:YbaK/EbsC family protein n=2 Tax=Pseudothauera rhizosphaerae TaxID=2565932 RepID=A0A4S4AZD8_9RHOO|nr:YbaK/EbsC family protein [Pseudothauera rhizosphaerae]
MNTEAPSSAPVSSTSSRTRVETALRTLGMPADIVEFGTLTRTSAEAAAAIGCEVAQIAKSVVFRGKTSDACVVVIASGADRIDEKKLAAEIGEKVGRADADFVRRRTGFAIGGVAPVGHAGEVTLLVDRALWALDPIWAAAGTPNAVFRLSADDLHRIPGIRVVDVRQI